VVQTRVFLGGWRAGLEALGGLSIGRGRGVNLECYCRVAQHVAGGGAKAKVSGSFASSDLLTFL